MKATVFAAAVVGWMASCVLAGAKPPPMSFDGAKWIWSSSSLGEERAKAILSAHPDLVVTGCPGCMMQIEERLLSLGSDVPVVHTMEALGRASRESRVAGHESRVREGVGGG